MALFDYTPCILINMQVPGFGPGSKAWKALVLDQTTLHLLPYGNIHRFNFFSTVFPQSGSCWPKCKLHRSVHRNLGALPVYIEIILPVSGYNCLIEIDVVSNLMEILDGRRRSTTCGISKGSNSEVVPVAHVHHIGDTGHACIYLVYIRRGCHGDIVPIIQGLNVHYLRG